MAESFKVLTPTQSSLLLLKQGHLDKFRLAYNPQKYTHKEIQHFNWFILDRRNRNSDDLETQSINVKRSPLRRADVFSFDANTKLGRTSDFVIKYCYHNGNISLINHSGK